MAFHEVQFSPKIALGSSGGPERLTEIVSIANGFEERNTHWAHSRRRYDAGLGVRTHDDLHLVLEFFEARFGRLYGFRWKDWVDCKSGVPSATPAPTDQTLGFGDGSNRAFQLIKEYQSGGESYARTITKPVAGSVVMAVDGGALTEGPDYTVDETTGLVVLSVAPGAGAVVSAGFEFDVPVRFDTDRIEINLSAFDAGDIPSVPIVEIRV